MAATPKYPDLFKSRYPESTFQGKDWLLNTDPEDQKAFQQIGAEASDHGRMGGQALVQKRGREYMAAIGARGAAKTNQLHAVNRMLEDAEEGESQWPW